MRATIGISLHSRVKSVSGISLFLSHPEDGKFVLRRLLLLLAA